MNPVRNALIILIKTMNNLLIQPGENFIIKRRKRERFLFLTG